MEAFVDLTILIGLSSILGIILNRLRQPLILGYIASGIIINSSGLLGSHSLEVLNYLHRWE
ncbi:MAG: hypothetical protein Q9M91_03590 [Candidatus Dojkabacteria bacterium]|nr:hypothetical protein [Candidatus Dojkabacteria bacterium]